MLKLLFLASWVTASLWALPCNQRLARLIAERGPILLPDGYLLPTDQPRSPRWAAKPPPEPTHLENLPELPHWEFLDPERSVYLKFVAASKKMVKQQAVSVAFEKGPLPADEQAKAKADLEEMLLYWKNLGAKNVQLTPEQAKKVSLEMTERIAEHLACQGVSFVYLYDPIKDTTQITFLPSGRHRTNKKVAELRTQLAGLNVALLVEPLARGQGLSGSAAYLAAQHTLNLGPSFALSLDPDQIGFVHETRHATDAVVPGRDLGKSVAGSKPLQGPQNLYLMHQDHSEPRTLLNEAKHALDDSKQRKSLGNALRTASRTLERNQAIQAAIQEYLPTHSNNVRYITVNKPDSLEDKEIDIPGIGKTKVKSLKTRQETNAVIAVKTDQWDFQTYLPLHDSKGIQDPGNREALDRALTHWDLISKNNVVQLEVAQRALDHSRTLPSDQQSLYFKAIRAVVRTGDWKVGEEPSLALESEMQRFNQILTLQWALAHPH